MIETFLTAFTTFFAVIGPIDTAVLLASLTPNMSGAERRAISAKAVVIATTIIFLFALVGQPVLTELGVSLAALQTAGGIILHDRARNDAREAARAGRFALRKRERGSG